MATTGLRTAAFGLLRNHAAVHQHCHGAVRPASVVLVLQQQRQQQRQQHGRRSIVTACAPRGLAPYQQLRFAQTDSRDTIMSNLPYTTIGDAEKPAVIVIQEWWGVNDEVKHQAQTVADKGYQAVIPDLYRGKVTLEVAEAKHLMEELNFPQAVQELDAIIGELRAKNPQRKVAVMGFCMGGALALAISALSKNRVDAIVPFYGMPPAALADLSTVKSPVQGHYGAVDNFIPIASVEKLQVSLKASGVPHEIFLYEGQGHAFLNALEWSDEARVKIGQPPRDNASIALAWSRVFEFLNKYLN